MLYFPRPTVRQEVFEYVLVAFNEMAVERLNQCENIVVLLQVSRAGFYRSLQAHLPMEEEMAVLD
jgi:hypothetical protein